MFNYHFSLMLDELIPLLEHMVLWLNKHKRIIIQSKNMFRKLLSNLPFNPSLINQLSFYAKKVHHETAVRSVGFGLMILAMLVQLFAVVSPPQPSLALSSNDLITGGFSSQNQAVSHCSSNNFDFKDVLDNFGVTCENLSTATTKEIKANDYSNGLYAVGRKTVGDKDPGTKKSTNETTVKIKDKDYYGRKLSSWDKDDHKKYKALVGKNHDGKTFAVLYNCGGVVVPEKPKPTPPPPAPTPPKTPPPAPTPPKVTDKCPNVAGVQTKEEECDVCSNIKGIQTKLTDCLPCDKAQNANDNLVCLSFTKSAKNVSQKIGNANGTVAKAGDEIEYSLTVKNEGKAKISKYVVSENLADVLEYASLTKNSNATLTGSVLSWQTVDLDPGQLIQKNFSVKIKSPLPNTPVSISDPNAYDLIMTNVYGNAVNIKLPATIIKATETKITTLPDTGPGISMVMVFITTTVIGYFYYRSRLVAIELDIAREEFTSSGGY